MSWNPNPIAFELFGVPIAWYGLSWSLAIIVGYFVMRFIFIRDQKDVTKLVPFIQRIFIGSLIGARLFEMLFYQTKTFFSNPLSFFYFRDGGLASHGAMLSTLLVIYLFLKKNKDFSFSYLSDRSVIAASLQGAIVRCGNFLNSELYGTATDVPWAVQFLQVDNLYRHPVQLYEAIWLFFCFLFFFFIYLNSKALKPWLLTSLFCIVAMGGRICLEFFKESERSFLFFSNTQLYSLLVVLGGIVLFLYSSKQKNASILK